MALKFAKSEALTLGVEVEVQLLDAKTFDLIPMSPRILKMLKGRTNRIKAEIFQSMLEITTGICPDAHKVRQDLAEGIAMLQDACARLGVRVAAAGTHPTANYVERKLFPQSRYRELIDRNRWIARRLMIFGVHFHLGMRNGPHAVAMNNALLHYLPVLLALSASSPFWNGEDTELASSRITFFEALPTGGHPCRITSWEQFEALHAKLLRSRAIRSSRDIWWDFRFSPTLGTLEIRICDGLNTLDEVVALAAFTQALAAHLDRQIGQGVRFDPPSDWVVRENKWRASRWGVESQLIKDEHGTLESLRDIVHHTLELIEPDTDRLGYAREMELITRLLEDGPSYLRQRRIGLARRGDLAKVTQFLAQEFEAGTPLWGAQTHLEVI